MYCYCGSFVGGCNQLNYLSVGCFISFNVIYVGSKGNFIDFVAIAIHLFRYAYCLGIHTLLSELLVMVNDKEVL